MATPSIIVTRLRLAGLSLAGLALTVVLGVEGQIGPDPQVDPLASTVSDYAVADRCARSRCWRRSRSARSGQLRG